VRRLAAAALCAALCGAPVAPAAAWWNCAWTQRVPLQVSGGTAGAPVEVVLDPATLPGYDWTRRGADLRIVDADDLTVLPHYVAPSLPGIRQLRVWFRLPAGASAGRGVYAYHGNAAAAATSDASLFTTPGVRLLTRRQVGPRPTSLDAFLAQFDAAAAPPGYGCAVLPGYVDESNAARFGAGSDVAYSIAFFLDVTPATAGSWSLRYGADLGYGGGLYVNGVELEQQWGDDLDWRGNYNNGGEVLAGTVKLDPGRHLVVAYGAEDCCDGRQAVQVRAPGSPGWQDLRGPGVALVAPACPAEAVTVARVPDAVALAVGQAVATVADPVSGTSRPKSIPGARKRWSVRVWSVGNAGALDSDSVSVVVPVPDGTSLRTGDLAGPGSGPVQFGGAAADGLQYAYGGLASPGDDLAFSRDGGATWSYVPMPAADGTDASITHLRVSPKGRPQCTPTESPAGFELQFETVVR
jgi:hypothetical protein